LASRPRPGLEDYIRAKHTMLWHILVNVVSIKRDVCNVQRNEMLLYVMCRQYSTDKWSTMLSLPDDWVFQQLSYNHFQFPPTLHVGDYDMDGFPDVVTVLSSPTLVVLLHVQGAPKK